MKKACALFLVILISGCTYSKSNSSTDSLTPKEQLCQELKRNIIFNATSGPTFGAASSTQKAEMYRLYDKNNCGQFERK